MWIKTRDDKLLNLTHVIAIHIKCNEGDDCSEPTDCSECKTPMRIVAVDTLGKEHVLSFNKTADKYDFTERRFNRITKQISELEDVI
jgi:hypothetical protein